MCVEVWKCGLSNCRSGRGGTVHAPNLVIMHTPLTTYPRVSPWQVVASAPGFFPQLSLSYILLLFMHSVSP